MPYINTKEEPCLYTNLTGATNVGTKQPREKDTPNKENERGDFTHLQYMLHVHVVVLGRCVYVYKVHLLQHHLVLSCRGRGSKKEEMTKGRESVVLAEKCKENVARKQTTKAKAKGKTTCPDILSQSSNTQL